MNETGHTHTQEGVCFLDPGKNVNTLNKDDEEIKRRIEIKEKVIKYDYKKKLAIQLSCCYRRQLYFYSFACSFQSNLLLLHL